MRSGLGEHITVLDIQRTTRLASAEVGEDDLAAFTFNLFWCADRIPGAFTLGNFGTFKGYSLVLPTTTEMMELYLGSDMDDEDLFDMVRSAWKFRPEALFLASAAIDPDYQNLGLATATVLESVERFNPDLTCGYVLPMFYDKKSKAALKLAERVRDKLIVRNELTGAVLLARPNSNYQGNNS